MNLKRSIRIYPIEVFESEFGGGAFTTDEEHSHARAIRIHEARKTSPGYGNRGMRNAWGRWWNRMLQEVYLSAGGIVHEVSLDTETRRRRGRSTNSGTR